MTRVDYQSIFVMISSYLSRSGDLRDGDGHVSVCSHHVCVCLAVDHPVDGLGSTSLSAAARQLQHQHYQPPCIGEYWGFSFLFPSLFMFYLVLLPLKDMNSYNVLILLSSLVLVVREHTFVLLLLSCRWLLWDEGTSVILPVLTEMPWKPRIKWILMDMLFEIWNDVK